ncbi:transcriptional regulator family: TEA/ATTS [Agaricus bisporus var. burnettii]|uniref:Transcriptional regulator family: TEA/ATTS n=1 Tax=Agaricus bisporus var. burnettii TaxID=192524 RepID=A0A8H7KFX6_AGABI|nr:transcriptional regulator family: TEA/ATTS [Agaricus bisporus var. burnettii]
MRPYLMSHFQVHGDFESTGSTAETITTQTMTVDDLSSTYTPQQSLAVVCQQDATGRRCHKTLRGGGEAVWPPNLEAALISGLQAYSDRYQLPTTSRSRGRFIGRNHFLSDFIKWATGRRRSAKQIGSRLQQLKETCRDHNIHFLVTGRQLHSHPEPRRSKKSSSKHSSRRSTSSTPEVSYDSCKEESEDQPTASEPEDYQFDISLQYVPQSRYREDHNVVPSPSIQSPSVGYEASPECSYPNSQSTVYYSASSDYCVEASSEWKVGAQQAQPTPYQLSPQQWEQYYSQLEQPQQVQPQQVNYYNSQYC